MTERTILDAVAGWFRRKRGAGQYCGECTLRSGGRADLIYVARADSSHVVEAKARADQWPAAFRQLARYPANYRWLALSKHEYEAYGGGIASESSKRGYGLLLVSGSSQRRIVEARRWPEYQPGRFDHRWNF